MKNKNVKLSAEEKARLTELLKLKRSGKLTDSDKEELEALNSKMGFSPRSKDRNRGGKTDFHPGNDFAWWNKYPSLTKDAANYKSSYIAGDPLSAPTIPYIVPGVIAIVMDSVYGKSKAVTDPLNVWARDLYLKMFQRFRVPSTYSASDLGIALLASNEVVKCICCYERIYGVINRYAKRNLNMPFTEARALGLSVANVTYLQGHLSDFRSDLNFLIQKAQRLVIPKDLSVVADSISLFGYSYLDHDNERAQIIEFIPTNFGIYEDNTVSTGGCIHFNVSYTQDMFDFTLDNMCKALDNMLNALLNSDSIQRMFADLSTWFGEGAFLNFDYLPDDFVVVPAYSESILHKIHNLETITVNCNNMTTWCDGSLSAADQGTILAGDYYVYQCNDKIISYPIYTPVAATYVQATYDGGTVNTANDLNVFSLPAHLLDTYRVEMNEETVVEGVMYKAHFALVKSGSNRALATVSCNFYIVRDIIAYTAGSTVHTWSIQNVVPTYILAATNAGLSAILDWAPLQYYVDYNGTGNIENVFGDIDVAVEIPVNGLIKLSRVIVMSGLQTDMKVIAK